MFMPLLSLIEDNLNFVTELGIPAVSLSNNSEKKSGNVYQDIRNGAFKIVYLTPEKFVKSTALLTVI